MAERAQAVTPVAAAIDEVRAPDVAPWDAAAMPSQGGPDTSALRAAVKDARLAIPLDQPDAAKAVNALLAALPASEPNGRLLLELLDTDALAGLADADGLACHDEAVRALLRLGFPWALEIHPDLLASFRERERGRRPAAGAFVAVLALVAALLAGGWWYWREHPDLWPTPNGTEQVLPGERAPVPPFRPPNH